ncbi:MAG: SocA family protein [Desulfovibrio sp.]|jgi:uncharacterized phage-associated protein|nr:SocA family protein [Desulfovibrio sp.]
MPTNEVRRREKLRNAVLYFVQNDKTVGLTKLMKLLFYLDFRLYRKTGESLTGETYQAWDFGPVPVSVWQEMRLKKSCGLNLNNVVTVTGQGFDSKLKAKKDAVFSDDYFSGTEKTELKNVSEMFKGIPARMVVKASHARNDPWDVTLKTKGKKAVIDYDLELDGCSEEEKNRVKEIQDDNALLEAMFG